MIDATSSRARLIVVNKIDLPPAWIDLPDDIAGNRVEISVRTEEGLDELRRQIQRLACGWS